MHRAPIRRARRVLATVAVLAAVAAGLASAPGALAMSRTLSRAGTGTSADWTSPDNWNSGVVPSGTVTTLTLPSAGANCSGSACEFGIDDIPALTVDTLQIDAAANYFVVPLASSNSIDLLDGLTFEPAAGTAATQRLASTMALPLTLGQAQTWTLQGLPRTPTQLTLGPVTGEQDALRLNLSGDVSLIAPELDTGPLTISGDGTVALAPPSANPIEGASWPPPLLSRAGVTLQNGASLAFRGTGAVAGPITFARGSYSTLDVGRGAAPDGTVTALGPVTLRAFTTVVFDIDQPAAVGSQPLPGADYSQLSAVGDVNLNDAGLNLSQGFSDGQDQCANLKGGQLYTLIAAAGRITGTFDGVANGQVVALGPCNPLVSGPGYAAVISYNTAHRPETVTARIVGAAQIVQKVSQSLAVTGPSATVAQVLKHGGYTETFEAPIAGKLALTWTSVQRGKRVTVASAALSAGRVGPFRLPIKLTKTGRQLLGRQSQLTLTATASFTPSGQKLVSVTRKLRLG